MNLIDSFIFPVPKSSYSLQTQGISSLSVGDFSIPIINFYKETNKYTLLYFHGNAIDIGYVLPLANLIFSKGFNFYAVEYPGYGEHHGNVSESSIYATAELVFQRLNKEGRQIIVVGQSIGTGPASEIASKYSNLIKCLVLVSPFKSISAMAYEKAPMVASFVGQRFDNLGKADKITCPYLLVHGKADSLVPYQHSVDLLKRNRSGKKQLLLAEGHGHNDILNDRMVIKCLDFINKWLT